MKWKLLFQTKGLDQLAEDVTISKNNGGSLRRTLGVWDLTAFGVAAILGAGIFSTIGNAAFDGGPAVIFLFIFTAIACAFSAFCYAEFASAIPVAGSAYTYAYASFGELAAWIIGWDLLMEYAISNVAVAISWSQYFTGLLASYGLHIPKYLSMDYLTASRSYRQVVELLSQGQTLSQLSLQDTLQTAVLGYSAWLDAPQVFGLRLICDLPALVIVMIVTWVVLIGIEESRKTSNILVLLKVMVVILVIGVGAVYVHPGNWTPFAPHGVSGVLKGVSAVFFAYIGFDAISTTAEECKNPQRDLPRGMIYSLVICTVLYSLMALVITGMVSYKKLSVGDPLAFVFGPQGANLPWVCGIVNVSAIVALSTVLLVYQIGQPRIWMAMSRDGLLPPIFSAIHPKYKTPAFSTILTGFFVAIPSLFMNLTEVTDLTSIGTLFAFILVCGGTLKMSMAPTTRNSIKPKFKTPYINSKYIFPGIILFTAFCLFYFAPNEVQNFFDFKDLSHPDFRPWEVALERLPLAFYLVSMLVLGVLCYAKELSLIPVMGLATCGYLMTELGITNWIRFSIWLVAGLLMYFLYGIKHSRLRRKKS